MIRMHQIKGLDKCWWEPLIEVYILCFEPLENATIEKSSDCSIDVHFAVVILTPFEIVFLLWIWTMTGTRPDVKT